jgi:hypothetical protein
MLCRGERERKTRSLMQRLLTLHLPTCRHLHQRLYIGGDLTMQDQQTIGSCYLDTITHDKHHCLPTLLGCPMHAPDAFQEVYKGRRRRERAEQLSASTWLTTTRRIPNCKRLLPNLENGIHKHSRHLSGI